MAKERQCLKDYENYDIIDRRINFNIGQVRQAITAIAKISLCLTWAALLAAVTVSPASAQPPASETAVAQSGTWTPERTAFGHVMPARDATLSAPFAATVTQVAVEPGQPVREGQVL